jgi:hypothetical protein
MKEFNVTGVCVPEKHYMVDISEKLKKIVRYIEKNQYFTINRARQYGKTTTLSQIYRTLIGEYIVLDISFEGLGDESFASVKDFSDSFIELVSKELKNNCTSKELIDSWEKDKGDVIKLELLSKKITELIENAEKEVVLLIDEVDKSSNNQLFLHFLGMLRNKYLQREKMKDKTFKSVILAGVYDVKNLKLKLRHDEEQKFNSPWNIATEFDVDMSFNSQEISTMLMDYEADTKTGMDIMEISNGIYKYTSGYPFIVSRLCKIIDEKLDKNWTSDGLENAIKILLNERNTLFDDLIKNIENYKDLYKIVYNLIIENEVVNFNTDAYELGVNFGILKNIRGNLTINNKIFEIRLYNYMIAKMHIEEVGKKLNAFTGIGIYENDDGSLDIKKALVKYQEYMKSVYSKFDREFIERQGRLLLLAFFKPILNGKGFYFVESHTGFEQRQDIVITFNHYKYIIELKIWRGEEYHQKGLIQLNSYLECESTDDGYLVIFNKNETKEYKSEYLKLNERNVFAVWV